MGAQPSTTRAVPMVEPIVQALRLRGRHGPAALRARGAASTSEASAVEQILDDLVLTVRTNGWNSCSWTAARRGLAHALSAKFNYEVRRVGWDEPPRNEHGAKVFRPSAMPGG